MEKTTLKTKVCFYLLNKSDLISLFTMKIVVQLVSQGSRFHQVRQIVLEPRLRLSHGRLDPRNMRI